MVLPPLTVKVWGDFACFTRPEMKVERVSYPTMTPSAARGLLEAIFWKPEFTWQVRSITVLRPIRYFSLVRNEVKNKVAVRSVRTWQSKGGGYFSDEDRTQRHTLALHDVAYIIEADMALRPHADADVAKYRDQFRRRVARGQAFQTPYLGCREFAASFSEPDGSEQPEPITQALGPMLFDLTYASDGSGRGEPMFFDAVLQNGILRVPGAQYERGR